MSQIPSFEQAGELKIGQVGIANLRVRELDVAKLVAEMRERVERAPKLFGRAAVIVDFGSLSRCPGEDEAGRLIEGLRGAGVLPVGLAFGTREIDALAERLGLPLLAKFRAQYEPLGGAEPALEPEPAPGRRRSERAPEPAPAPVAAASPPPASTGQMQIQPVRSGQQVYAQGRDLTVCAMVGNGAEVIADGSIHIYGSLRGRALAGARGDVNARIFCREFNAELVAIAGQYRVLESIPAELRGKPVQVWLENDKLQIAAMA
ncbi:septum site-determining protein MinC [Aquimonas voraii]|uniref:Probable septum site-determining protein MinC n=1 Tax=Aquimonas voraii TaxID=265719 RepID=A0A1G6SU88_9GAMM|nr:septum site-determining protein MinC [Aquimonas voraii]SDD20261.1 septum site-determining protein MinC [Aquimonas voraii]